MRRSLSVFGTYTVDEAKKTVTYKVVAFLKKKENEDYYDRDTDFTPFSLKT